jgi:hypothetical protein
MTARKDWVYLVSRSCSRKPQSRSAPQPSMVTFRAICCVHVGSAPWRADWQRCTLRQGRFRRSERTPTIQLDEEQTIAVRELDATAYLALQHGQLMPQGGILCFKSARRLEWRGQQPENEA